MRTLSTSPQCVSAVSPLLQRRKPQAQRVNGRACLQTGVIQRATLVPCPSPRHMLPLGVRGCVSPQLGNPGGTCTHRRSSLPFPPARSRLEGSCRLSPVVTLQGTDHLEASWQPPPAPPLTRKKQGLCLGAATSASFPAALGCLWVLRPSSQLWCAHSEAHSSLTCPRLLLKSALGKCVSLCSVHLSHPGI